MGFRLLEAEREREMDGRARAGGLPHARLAVLICAGTVLGLFSLVGLPHIINYLRFFWFLIAILIRAW